MWDTVQGNLFGIFNITVLKKKKVKKGGLFLIKRDLKDTNNQIH